MKRIFLFFSLAVVGASFVFAQTQYGYVKTKGRIGNNGQIVAGVRLPGATIRLKGKNVVSQTSGKFSFAVTSKRYTVLGVQKQGYQLYDYEQLREYNYSSNPLELVLEKPEDRESDRLMWLKKMNRTLRRQLEQREDELEKMKEENKISQHEYQRLCNQLYSDEKNNQELIEKMAEKYASMDFDKLDDEEREIKILILNGEFQKADSIINAKGKLEDRIASYKAHKKANEQRENELSEQWKILQKSQAVENLTLNELANDCENKCEMYKLKCMRDSAAYYIQTRAELDTLNCTWQLEAGLFMSDYLADYDAALRYFHRALSVALANEGEKCEAVAVSYNNIGFVYEAQGDYSHALEMHQKALKIRLEIFGENHPDVAISYGSMGSAYESLDNYTQALELCQKALKIQLEIFGENHPDVATTYNNIGSVYDSQGDYSKALEMYQKALKIDLEIFGENHPDVATSFHNVGYGYSSQGDYFHALEMYQKALKIRLEIFDENHPDVAASYNNIGRVYDSQGDYSHALEMHQKALKIWLEIFGENHPSVATSYNNIGYVYSSQGDYSHALEMYQKALKIDLEIFGENHSDVAASFNNIGYVYSSQGDYSHALEMYQKALKIRLENFGENHPDVAASYNNIGAVYESQGDYSKALEQYQKALKIDLETFGENHPNVATTYNNIGLVYDSQDDYFHALEMYQKALKIRLGFFGENHSAVATSYNNIGLVYCCQGNYSRALEMCQKALKIRLEIFGESHPDVTTIYNNMAGIYWAAKNKGIEIPGFVEFTTPRLFIATTIGENTPASKAGMNGEFYVLEFAEWTMDSDASLFAKNDEMRGKPKTIVVMKDGIISQYHFENAIGVQLGYKYVGEQEKQRILKVYRKWKKHE